MLLVDICKHNRILDEVPCTSIIDLHLNDSIIKKTELKITCITRSFKVFLLYIVTFLVVDKSECNLLGF